MTTRSVYIGKKEFPYFDEVKVQMEWFGGFALSQKRKCEISLHNNFLQAFPDTKILEVSRASTVLLGKSLSAMLLPKEIKKTLDGVEHHGVSSVESVYHSSKVFSDGQNHYGPYEKCLMLCGNESKKKVREFSNGMSCVCMCDELPCHTVLGYNYIYMNALLEERNVNLVKQIIEGKYTAFSDLATVSLSSQARSCAMFVGLYRAGLLSNVKTIESYLKLFNAKKDKTGAYVNTQIFSSEHLSSETVPYTFRKEQVEEIFAGNFGHLSNKKEDDMLAPFWID